MIQKALKRAKAIHGTAVVMTFDPHPVHVLRPRVSLSHLISLPYRLRLLAQMGVDACIVVKFTKKFSRLTPQQFVQNYLVGRINPSAVIVGDDFRFGRNRQGTLAYFRKAAKLYHFELLVVPSRQGGRKTISSTNIRALIAQGDIARAGKLLGRPVSILGRVVKGDARGRELGYPTANIKPDPWLILPLGVFLVDVRWKKEIFLGMANVGHRPYFKKTGPVNVEVHLFDFQRNLYGETIVVNFLRKLRDERNFCSKQELVNQIREDEKKARLWFRGFISRRRFTLSSSPRL